jgi:hypothetical protein
MPPLQSCVCKCQASLARRVTHGVLRYFTTDVRSEPVMASPQLPGLQACEISDLTLDTATEPKEGGNGNTVAPHAAL